MAPTKRLTLNQITAKSNNKDILVFIILYPLFTCFLAVIILTMAHLTFVNFVALVAARFGQAQGPTPTV